MRRTLLILALISTGCQSKSEPADPDTDAPDSGDPTVPVALAGAAAKGPLVTGSSIAVSPLDDDAQPTGSVYSTQTDNDLGEFTVELPAGGFVALEAYGFYYNEVQGGLSGAPITLRGIAEVTSSGRQNAYVNVVTHLTDDRTRALVQGGATLADAVDRSLDELVAGLGLGPDGFDPGAAGSEMNVLGGDTPANRYVFAVSTVLAEAAVLRGGSVDAVLQELLNTVGDDLADDGALEADLATEVWSAQASVDMDAVEENFAARLADVGSTAVVPNLGAIVDSDLDGIVNDDDVCRFVGDADQLDTDADGVGDACECGNGVTDELDACDDGDTDSGDGCSATCEVEVGFACSVCEEAEANGGACPAGTVCIEGDCAESPGDWFDCRADAECPLGWECDHGSAACMETGEDNPVDECRAECGDGIQVAGEECDDGNVIARDGCGVRCQLEDYDCYYDSMCAEMTWCDKGHCTEGCKDSSECAVGEVCEDHACATAPPCTEDTQCDYLGTDFYCTEGGACHALCWYDTECESDEYCDTTIRECAAGPAVGEACLVDPTGMDPDGYCVGGLECVDGVCQAP